jgi:DNA polymerase III delta prime subunit
MTDRQILQLLVDALQAILNDGEGNLQAQIKVEQAQAALLEDEA